VAFATTLLLSVSFCNIISRVVKKKKKISVDKQISINYNITMKIILSTYEDIEPISDRYITLELDTFRINGELVPSWCLIDSSDVALGEMTELDHWIEQHNNLIKNYKRGDFNFCKQMVDHLRGRFGGNVDSFYTELYARMQQPKADPWDPVIEKD